MTKIMGFSIFSYFFKMTIILSSFFTEVKIKDFWKIKTKNKKVLITFVAICQDLKYDFDYRKTLLIKIIIYVSISCRISGL